ncbi:MAG: phosphoglycerate dehydrogenase, partial [Bacillota bacterium]
LEGAGFEVVVNTGLAEDALIEEIKDFDALVVRSGTQVTAKVIESGEKLKIIARAGVGVDNVDIPAATKRGIVVVNSPAGNTFAAAELTIAHLLALARHLPQAHASLKQGKWDRKKYVGVELRKKVIGVVGLGKIGRTVASIAQGLLMKVIGFDPFVTKEQSETLGIDLVTLDELYQKSDFITFHLPLNEQTKHMVADQELALMKKTAYLINVARGGIIDENALYTAIKEKQLAGAAIDVFEKEPCTDSPLLELDQVIATPHLGASTIEAQINVAIDVAEDVVSFLNGRTVANAVNLPAVAPEVFLKVAPYLETAERLGKMYGQLYTCSIQEIEIVYKGKPFQLDTQMLTASLVKGLLSVGLEHPVTLVNAMMEAKDRGIKIKVTKEMPNGSGDLIAIKGKGQHEHVLGATSLKGLGPRLLNFDGFRVDIELGGNLLVVPHKDKPGVIGKVGMLLGEGNVNIGAMDVGRKALGKDAVMVISVDQNLSKDVLEKITKIDGVENVTDVRL